MQIYLNHSEVKCDIGIERGEIGLCIPRKIWVTVSKFEEFYVQKFDRCRVKHLSDRVELSTREWNVKSSILSTSQVTIYLGCGRLAMKQAMTTLYINSCCPTLSGCVVVNGALATQPCKVVSYRGHHGEIGIHFPLIPPVTVLFPGAAVSPCSAIPFWVRLSS